MRTTRPTTLLLLTLGTSLAFLPSTSVSADTIISVIWESTGTSSVVTSAGATETAQIWVETDMEGLLVLSHSLQFDEAGENLLDVVFSEEIIYAPGEINNSDTWTHLTLTAGELSDSELGSPGLLVALEGIGFPGIAGPFDITFKFAEVDFLTNAFGTTEVIPFFTDGRDIAVDNDDAVIPVNEIFFNGATITIVPEPAAGLLVALGALAVATRRRLRV